MRESLLGGETLDAVTKVFPGRDCDETGRARDVALRYGLRWKTVDGTCADVVAATAALGFLCDQPLSGATAFQVPILLDAAAELEGCTVVTGFGGDDFWCAETFPAADLLLNGRLREAWQMTGAASVMEAPRAAWRMARHGFAPLLKLWMARVPLAGRVSTFPQGVTPPRRLWDDARTRPVWNNIGWRRRADQMAFVYSAPLLENLDQLAARWGMSFSHPLMDREMADLAFRCPRFILHRDGDRKGLLRRAMNAYLPESVIKGEKVIFDSVAYDGIEEKTESMLGPRCSWRVWGGPGVRVPVPRPGAQTLPPQAHSPGQLDGLEPARPRVVAPWPGHT